MWKTVPLLFLIVVDEIEVITFLAVGILGRRIDAFVFLQDALFPAALWVALLTVMALLWWGRPPAPEQRPYGYVGR
jgi:hypothetical protein